MRSASAARRLLRDFRAANTISAITTIAATAATTIQTVLLLSMTAPRLVRGRVFVDDPINMRSDARVVAALNRGGQSVAVRGPIVRHDAAGGLPADAQPLPVAVYSVPGR